MEIQLKSQQSCVRWALPEHLPPPHATLIIVSNLNLSLVKLMLGWVLTIFESDFLFLEETIVERDFGKSFILLQETLIRQAKSHLSTPIDALLVK